jgi:hypothetical protein
MVLYHCSAMSAVSVGRSDVVVEVTNMWGEVSMCDTPPTLIILQVDLVHYFNYTTRITTDNWYRKSVMLRLTVSQSVCLGVKFTLELVTRYFLSESC